MFLSAKDCLTWFESPLFSWWFSLVSQYKYTKKGKVNPKINPCGFKVWINI